MSVRFFPRPLRLLAALLVAGVVSAQEVQHQGLVFEEWVDVAFFGGYRPPSYTQKWDLPAAENKTHGGVPVNPNWRIAGKI